MCFLFSALSARFEWTRCSVNRPVVHTGNLDRKFTGEWKICCSALSNMPAGGFVRRSFSIFFFFHPQVQIGCVWSPTFTGKWRKYLCGWSEPQTRRRGNWGVCEHNFSNLPQHLHLVSSHFSHCRLNKIIVCFSLREKEVKVGHTVWSLIWGSNCIQAITSGRGAVVGEARGFIVITAVLLPSLSVCGVLFLAPPRRIQRLILLQWDALLPRGPAAVVLPWPEAKSHSGCTGLRIHRRRGETHVG